MRILVTGAAGFIGTHLCVELADHGHQIGGCDRLWADTHPRFLGDLHDDVLERAIDKFRPEVVVHLAARVGRLFGEDDIARTIADNASLTARVARVCGDHGIRLVYASTSEVYGDRGDDDCVEEFLYDPERWWAPAIPHNVYGLSKRWGEEACRLYAPEGLTVWRISMPYGPGLPVGRGRAAIINMLWQALHLQPIPVHRGAERSWCWIGDTVRGMRMTIEETRGGVFNVGRDDAATSMERVAELACELAGAPESLIELIDAPARQTVVKRLSTEKLRMLGWRPQVELADGMERTLDWVRKLPGPSAVPA